MALKDSSAATKHTPSWTFNTSSNTSTASRFKFTPVADSKKKKKITRLWDRNPSTPFAARSKSHKVWKRIRTLSASTAAATAAGNMATGQRKGGKGIAGLNGEMEYDNELLTEIARSGDSNYIRGVKRLRTVDGMKERSFLETKWESELSTRKRKYPDPTNFYVVGALLNNSARKQDAGPLVEESYEVARSARIDEDTPRCLGIIEREEDPNSDVLNGTPRMDIDSKANEDKKLDYSMASPVETVEEESEEELEDFDCQRVLFPVDTDSGQTQTEAAKNDPIEHKSTVVDEVEDNADALNDTADPAITETSPTENNNNDGVTNGIVMGKPAKAVATSLNIPALAGDDAELFSGFLSRAKAKREANCGMTPNGSTSHPGADHATHSPTPRARRVLEQLDKNSPTPQKPQLSSLKSENLLASPTNRADSEKSVSNETVPEQPETTTRRRSNRTRAARAQRPHAPPDVPAQIPVRRANGTEFIFLKRTEAQQTALTTRANTRRNKGNAQMPKDRLQEMAKQQQQGETIEEVEASGVREAAASPHVNKKPMGKKQVSWDEQNLVQYADGRDPEDEGHAVESFEEEKQGKPEKKGAGNNSSTGRLPKRLSTPTAKKRVRRLGTPSSSSVISSTSGHTPMPKRTRLLAPRSPKLDATWKSNGNGNGSGGISSNTRSGKGLTGRRNGQAPALPVKSAKKANGVK